MKTSLLTLAFAASLTFTCAQEKLSREEALQYAKAVSADSNQLKSTPIVTDLDLTQPVVVKDEDYGGMVLPQKGLKAETVAAAGGTAIPIGQLWLHKLTPMRDGQPISSDKLRMARVKTNDEELKVPQCTLAVRKTSDGTLELLVLGKTTDPILTTPLKPIDLKQSAPLDIEGEREGEHGRMTLNLLGKYQAVVRLTELEL